MERDGLAEEWLAEPQAQLDGLRKAERTLNATLEAHVRRHPLAAFVERTPGLGYGGLGRLLAVTGSLSRFSNPAKLWAYVGMHVVSGRAPKAKKGERANWARQGRVVCHQIAESMVKLGEGKYREIYDKRRADVLARPRVGDSACPFGHDHVGLEREQDAKGWQRKTGKARVVQCVKTDDEGHETSAHVHADAMRVAVKELLKDLWVEWRRIEAAR